jgi:hypothetical protein
MITKKVAIQLVERFSAEDIRRLAERILRTGIGGAPVVGHESAPAEDVIIQLLRSEQENHEAWQAALSGCQNVLAELLAWLAGAGYEHEKEKWTPVVIRTVRVVDICGPPQLMGQANAMLELLLQRKDRGVGLLAAAARACAHYRDSALLPTWERIISREPEAAAYAFNAILEIEANSGRIEGHLFRLWEHRIHDGWSIDCEFLMRRAAKKHGKSLINRVLARLQEKDWWGSVQVQLRRREWSQEWLTGYLAHKTAATEVEYLKEEVPKPKVRYNEGVCIDSGLYRETVVTHFYTQVWDFSTREEKREEYRRLQREGCIEFEESDNRDITKGIRDDARERHTDRIG